MTPGAAGGWQTERVEGSRSPLHGGRKGGGMEKEERKNESERDM